jgi:lysozyme family protein
MNFDESFTKLLGNEGGYSYNPADPGGETMWGVTKSVAQANGYEGLMKDFPQSEAKALYFRLYWSKVSADDLPDDFRFHIFDAAVNSGVAASVKWLQRVVGVIDDGVIGPVTLKAAQSMPGYIIAAKFNGHRLEFMTGLSTRPSFGRGWATRIAKNLKG